MRQPVQLVPLAINEITTVGAPIGSFIIGVSAIGSFSQIAAYGPMIGGLLTNPIDQGSISPPEPLYVSLEGPTPVGIEGSTFALQPGESFRFPYGNTSDVWVAAATAGHPISGFVIQLPPGPPTPFPSPFPPIGPTTLTKTIPSYLYQEYSDDDDLQAFVASFNTLVQEYVDWFVNINLPIYTGLSGGLLDWVGTNLYGMPRPSLPSYSGYTVGPFNTFTMNQGAVPFNYFAVVGAVPFYATTDDTYKRILTWLFFKGDGKVFTIPWLKRRLMRFLNGVNGVNYNVDNTYPISVTFESVNTVNINVEQYNPALAEAISSGVLELPFQYNFVVTGT